MLQQDRRYRKIVVSWRLLLTLLMGTVVIVHNASAVTAPTDTGLFVDAAWLKANRHSVVVVDARSEKDFRKGHIPGAVSAPWQPFTRMDGNPGSPGWGTLRPPEELAGKIGDLGIDGSKPLVVYADTPGWGEDGRFVWMAIGLGITDVRILDGGIRAWRKIDGEISREASGISVCKPRNPEWNADLTATTDWILSRLNQILIVDTRAEREFNGATPYGEARGGHLPGAISIPFKDLFRGDGTIKSQQELKQMFQAAGLTPESEIVTYCTAGIRSAHMALVMRMTGFEKTRNYDASYYEWAARKHLPVE